MLAGDCQKKEVCFLNLDWLGQRISKIWLQNHLIMFEYEQLSKVKVRGNIDFLCFIETAESGTSFFLRLFKKLPWTSRNASNCVRAMRQTKMVRMCTYECST